MWDMRCRSRCPTKTAVKAAARVNAAAADTQKGTVNTVKLALLLTLLVVLKRCPIPVFTLFCVWRNFFFRSPHAHNRSLLFICERKWTVELLLFVVLTKLNAVQIPLPTHCSCCVFADFSLFFLIYIYFLFVKLLIFRFNAVLNPSIECNQLNCFIAEQPCHYHLIEHSHIAETESTVYTWKTLMQKKN